MSKKLLAKLSAQAVQRIVTSIVGISILIFYNYFLANTMFGDFMFAIMIFVLYSEMLIACYISEITLWKKAVIMILGWIYLILGLSALIVPLKLGFILQFFATVFCVDISAYVVGNAMRGPKLVPKISPNKTVSGFVGGTIIGAIIFQLLLASHLYQFSNPVNALLVGVLFAIIVQVGDLLVSFVKRVLKIKDASNLLPGHGGFWDRCDSLFAGAIFVLIFMMQFNNVLLG